MRRTLLLEPLPAAGALEVRIDQDAVGAAIDAEAGQDSNSPLPAPPFDARASAR